MIVAVTGLIRSGTTPLAMMLHNMGLCMGTYMRFPVNSPVSHFEWEDAEIAEPLLAEILKPSEGGHASRVIDYYIRRRHKLSRGKAWGFKTPFLLPFLSSLRATCDALDEPVKVILTQRDMKDSEASLRRQAEHLSEYERGGILPRLDKIQGILSRAWLAASEDAHVFEFKRTQEYPRDVAKRLAGLVGIEADPDLAIRGIGVGG